MKRFRRLSKTVNLYFVAMQKRSLLERKDVQDRIIEGPLTDYQAFLLDPRNRSLVGSFVNKLSDQKFHEHEEALVLYAKSFYYYKHYLYEEYVLTLTDSLRAYSGFVWPQYDLGKYYKSIGKTKESAMLLQDALANVKKVYKFGDFIDFTSLSHFIDENLKGTTLGTIDYASVKDLASDYIS